MSDLPNLKMMKFRLNFLWETPGNHWNFALFCANHESQNQHKTKKWSYSPATPLPPSLDSIHRTPEVFSHARNTTTGFSDFQYKIRINLYCQLLAWVGRSQNLALSWSKKCRQRLPEPRPLHQPWRHHCWASQVLFLDLLGENPWGKCYGEDLDQFAMTKKLWESE